MDVHVQKHHLDLTGRSPLNLISDEKRILQGEKERFFAPHGGAFYAESVTIFDVDNNQPLNRDQFRFALYFTEPTEKSGKEVFAGIVITDEVVSNNIRLSYQVVGDSYSSIAPAIIDAMEDLDLNEREVRWGRILGRPDFLPPQQHLTDIVDIYGWEFLVNLMKKIHVALLEGDGASHDEIFAMLNHRLDLLNVYFDGVLERLDNHEKDIDDPHDVTKTQVGLSKVDNYPEGSNSDLANEDLVTNKFVTPARMHWLIGNLWVPNYDDHISDFNNPHKVTKAQVSLGNVNNFPMASNALTITGDNNYSYIHPQGMRFAITEQGGRLVDEHIADKENPHEVTKAQIGLGNVVNFTIADENTARQGVSEGHYLTPLMLSHAIDEMVGNALGIHTKDFTNPHGVTKEQLNLGNVDNISLAEMDNTFEPSGDLASVQLDGKAVYYQAEPIDLTITNYHVGSSYSANSTVGNLSVSNGKLVGTVLKDATVGEHNLTVVRDGKARTVKIDVKFSGVRKPTITAPSNSGRVPVDFVVRSTPFSVIPWDSYDSHRRTVWQVARDAGFTQIEAEVNTGSQLTAVDISNMPLDTRLYIRVKHYGYKVTDSPWSDTYVVDTQRNPKPVVSASGRTDQGRITREFTMNGSAFAGDGTHDKTQWVIRDASNNVVWNKTLTGELRSHTPYDAGFRPDSNAGLKMEIRYHSNSAEWSPWSDQVALTVMRRRVTEWTTSQDVSRVTSRKSSYTTRFLTNHNTQVYMERFTDYQAERQTTKKSNWNTEWTTRWNTSWEVSRSTQKTTYFDRNTDYSASTSYTTRWNTSKSTYKDKSKTTSRSTQYQSAFMVYDHDSRVTRWTEYRSTWVATYNNPGPGGCIAHDTPMELFDGTKKLASELEVGDVLLGVKIPGAIDESVDGWKFWSTESLSGMEGVEVKIVAVARDQFRAAYRINDTLTITKEHEILVNKGRGWRWLDARDIEVGDIILNGKLEETLVEEILYVQGNLDVINIDVEDVDNYVAGNILIHNQDILMEKR